MQCRRWQGDAYRLADRHPPQIVHQVLARPDAHRIAVKTARVGALHDLAAQYDTALDRLTGLAKPHILAAEMGIEERVAGPASDSLGGQQCGIDFDAVADLLSIATHPQRHDIAGAHEGRDEGRIGAIVDLFRGSDLGGSSGIEDDDAGGERRGLLPFVGDMHGVDAERLLQRFDLVAHLLTNPRVEIGQRFVEQQYLRIDGKSAAERNALPLTAGECRYLALAEPLQPQHREQLGHSPGDLGAADAPQFQAVADVLRHRHVRPQSIGLEHHRDVALVGRQPGNIVLADRYRAACHSDKTAYGAKQGGLAAARRTQKRYELAACSPERDMVEHAVCAIEDAYLAHVERHGGRGHAASQVTAGGRSSSPTSSSRKAVGVVKWIPWMPSPAAASALTATSSI